MPWLQQSTWDRCLKQEKYAKSHPEYSKLSTYEKMVIKQQIHHEAIGLTPLNLILDFVEDPQFDEFRAVEY